VLVVVIGKDELEAGSFKLKNLATGNEAEYGSTELIGVLRATKTDASH